MCREVLTLAALQGWQIGTTRVFLRAGQLAALEVQALQSPLDTLDQQSNCEFSRMSHGCWRNHVKLVDTDHRHMAAGQYEALLHISAPHSDDAKYRW